MEKLEKNKFIKCFKLYKTLKDELEYYTLMRKSKFGIYIEKDKYAIKWQSKQMRLEILEAFLEGRNIQWNLANYLSVEEKDRRNNK